VSQAGVTLASNACEFLDDVGRPRAKARGAGAFGGLISEFGITLSFGALRAQAQATAVPHIEPAHPKKMMSSAMLVAWSAMRFQMAGGKNNCKAGG